MLSQVAELYKDTYKGIFSRISSFFLRKNIVRRSFERWENRDVHVLQVKYYSPVPDTRVLRKNYPKTSEMLGVDLDDTHEIELLKEFLEYQDEYNAFKILNNPTPEEIDKADTFVLPNEWYYGIDPHIYYSMIRKFKPKKILAIGEGHSIRVARMAVDKNGGGQITCIEPNPEPYLLSVSTVPNVESIQEKVEHLDLSMLTDLQANDILFIDSSHTVKIGGDVSFLILEVLPRLRPGVVIQFHDIFLPDPQPQDIVLNKHLFWMEQSFLQAYLSENKHFKVLLATHYMCTKHPELIRESFPKALDFEGTSFWIQKL